MKIKTYYIFFIWIVTGLLYGILSYSSYSLRGMSCNFWGTLVYEVPNFVLWGGYTPLIFFLFQRFTFRKPNPLRSILLIHLPVALMISTFHIVAMAGFHFYFATEPIMGSFTEVLSLYSGGWLYLQLMLYAVVLVTSYAYNYYLYYQKERETALNLEKQLVDAQLSTLKMQLQPHFMFNTLNTVSVLILKRENKKAMNVISNFSNMLRHVLDSQSLQLIALSKELELVEEYLSIESVRFQDRFSYKITADINTLSVLVPHMLLQPTVENAFKHGFKDEMNNNFIEITARIGYEHLVITILNNGKSLASTIESSSKIGLKNIRDRLETIYGEHAFFQLSDCDNGVKALYCLPIKTNLK